VSSVLHHSALVSLAAHCAVGLAFAVAPAGPGDSAIARATNTKAPMALEPLTVELVVVLPEELPAPSASVVAPSPSPSATTGTPARARAQRTTPTVTTNEPIDAAVASIATDVERAPAPWRPLVGAGLDHLVGPSPTPASIASPLALGAIPRIPRHGGRPPRTGESALRWRRDGDGWVATDGIIGARIGADGSIVAFDDPPAVELETPLSMSFDVSDMVMRAAGLDPYQSRKLSVMDTTRATRASMAMAAEDQRLQQAIRDIRGRLLAIWSDTSSSIERRRELVYLLWEECAETGSASRLRASRAIRSSIEAFVREHAPRGSREAYTAIELQRLNRGRTSGPAFSPYSTPDQR